MDEQNAEKVACSSRDLVRSVGLKLKYYLELRRREDGFDTSPSALPRRQFPNLLPRPMLMSTCQDLPLKHHFSHASVRKALSRIQSARTSRDFSIVDRQREGRIRREVRALVDYTRIDHLFWFANAEHGGKNLETLSEGKKDHPPLRNGIKTIVRAPPPCTSRREKQRICDAACEIILGVEAIGRGKRFIDMGNTKLQSLNHPAPMQASFTPAIHRKYVKGVPRVIPSTAVVQHGKHNFVYDLNGRRHQVAQ